MASSPPIAANLRGWDYDFQGRTAEIKVGCAPAGGRGRTALLLAARSYRAPSFQLRRRQPVDCPLIVTGHQPELFHPGVWIKNFATASIASAAGGVGLNLIVDNDIPKSTSIAVPMARPGSIRLSRVEFDRWGGDAPFEDSPVLDEACFSSFADRVRSLLGDSIPGPLIDDYWPRVLARRGEAVHARHAFFTRQARA